MSAILATQARAEVLSNLRAACALHPRVPEGVSGPERVPTGFAALDDVLGGGLHGRALNEIYVAAAGSGALEALLPCLHRAGTGRRFLVWIHPSRTPYPPALVQQGFDLRRWLVVRPPGEDEHLWALDQTLRAGACDAAVTFAGDLSDRLLRRLQLAAEESGTLALLVRPAALATRPSPAAVRLSAEPVPARDPRRRRVRFRVLKSRGAFGLQSSRDQGLEVEWSRDPLDVGAAS
jgi:hypothetical protein